MNGVLLRVGAGGIMARALLRAWYRTHRGNIVLGILLTSFIIVAMWEFIAKVIPAGHVGVEWHRFAGGTDTETVYEEGTHFILPWDKMAVYDARLQQFDRDFDVLTRDGLTMIVNIAVRFRLNQIAVGLLHKHVGPGFVDTLLVPTVGSFARIVFSQNSTDEIYTDRRIAVQLEIKKAVLAELDHYLGQRDRRNVPWLFLDDVLIRSMHFPPEVESAVNRKMEQYQLRQEYSYRLEREKLESERKEIEARGIALFQKIVGSGISDTYLRWKGIDATLALARSPNAKIIVVGTGKDGLPLILGGLDQSKAALPTVSPDKTPPQNGSPDPDTSSTVTPSSLSAPGAMTPSE